MIKLSSSQLGNSPTIGLRIPAELRQRLDVLAAVQGVERSELIRRLIVAVVCLPDKKMARREDQSLEPGAPERGEYDARQYYTKV
jgi:predicted DNA-binding protein